MTEQDLIIQQLRREVDSLKAELERAKTAESVARMCYWPEKEPPLLLYGYEVGQLVVLANVLKDGEVRPDELRRYTDGVEAGYRRAMDDFQAQLQRALNPEVYCEACKIDYEEEKPE